MKDSIMLDKAKDLAVNTVKLCKNIKENKKEYILTNQLLKSATSVGANIHESKYAQSNADFVSKMKIALKECYETEYWLEILVRTEYISEADFRQYTDECKEIRRMLVSSINTTERNNNKQR